MGISSASNTKEDFDYQKPRVGSKKSVQQGRSRLDARSVLALREYGQMARTPLTAFFNGPVIRFINRRKPKKPEAGFSSCHQPSSSYNLSIQKIGIAAQSKRKTSSGFVNVMGFR